MNRAEVSLTGCPARDAVMTAASAASIVLLVPVALKQLGITKHVPEPAGPIFNSDGITSSNAAYPLGIPDSVLGMGSFAATLALIFAARRSRGARALLGGKLALDASAAVFNLGRQVVQFRAVCSWCTGSALAALTASTAGKMLIADAASEAIAAIDAAREESA